ncbi:PREDICTED: AT-rich interactive domain-containing protein 1B-like [Dinoponera quadriceps]|uniref:AT-rich interactive domain-containing protein 1B-like n=1 Tax=Dinoponera quadriceps TaxID=609295 RepID=A0A6P3Y067_DINQU|nr:PREDICTED: AT-rich interactive domain-containing protein 1B-like [Dinoponera quadriceps]
MAGWLSFVLVAIALTIAIAESRVIPAEPVSVMLDAYGNPIMVLREKRTVVHPYPQRAMMFTGYYRPVRRSNNGGQATGVFAQGNAVSGEAFFSGMPHLGGGPEPIEEVSSAEAQAAPASEEAYNEEEERQQQPPHREHHHHQQEEHHHEHHRHEEEEQPHRDEHHHRHQQDSQEHHEPEQVPLTTEIAQPTEEPIAASTEVSEVSVKRPKAHNKKTQKTPVIVDDDNDDEDEADEEDDEPVAPFVPFKGNRRRQGYPNLNNYFPMVFSFPRAATRSGSAGSPPGTITAIANSYSTGKGGVASSVATAYGGSPTGKKRRSQSEE